MSDLPAHVNLALKFEHKGVEGYSLLHKTLGIIGSFMEYSDMDKKALYDAMMILVLVIANFFSVLIIRNYFLRNNPQINPYIIDFISISLFVVSMLVIWTPFYHRIRYLGVGTPNPWHNPTYIFCRPFSLLVFILLLKSHSKFQSGLSSTKELVMLSIFSVLSMWAKPSFLICFLPAVFILYLYLILKKRITLKYYLLTGMALIPSLVPLYLINNTVYHTAEAANSIIVTFGKGWYQHTNSILVSIALGMAFPIFITFNRIRHLSIPHLLAIIMYLVAALEYFFLLENGTRMYDSNFTWGYLFSMFFMFMVCCDELVFKRSLVKNRARIGYVLLFLHLISGCLYLGNLMLGSDYM